MTSNGTMVVDNVYDYMWRRVKKVVNGVTNEFVYDGWNVVLERRAEASAMRTNYYVWGLDLSGSLQGAGGIGGLLAVTKDGGTCFPAYDANGNVTDLLGTNGTIAAHYEYDPYGNIIAQAGAESTNNSFRFSTKYLDSNVGLYYYGYRFYNPQLGRWLKRDPLFDVQPGKAINPLYYKFSANTEELNLCAFVHNSPPNFIDPDGRAALPILLPILAGTIWAGACHHYAIENARDTFPDDDKKQHCYGACFFNRCMLSAPGLTALGALWQEISSGQLFTEPREAIDDIKAGLYGIAKSYSFSSCKDQCDKCPVP